MHRLTAVVAMVLLAGTWPRGALAQSRDGRFAVGAQMTSAASGEFDATDAGLGARVSWHPSAMLGLEAEINLYPRDFPSSRPFSRSRAEGLFGVTAGPRVGRVRPFARVRPGFLVFRGAPEAFACILIYPPPLSCTLAQGGTLPAVDAGGGVEIFTTRTTFVRVDAGDRLLRYRGPALGANQVPRDSAFWGHDFRFSAGAGLTF